MKKQDTSYLKFLLPIVFIIQGSTANKPLFSSTTTKPIEHVDSLEFPRKKEYLAKRQILILKDQKINFSHAIKLTEKEKKLNALISDIAKGF